MIKKRAANAGVNANISLEPSAASQSTNNLTNNIIINKRDDGKEDIVITREIIYNVALHISVGWLFRANSFPLLSFSAGRVEYSKRRSELANPIRSLSSK